MRWTAGVSEVTSPVGVKRVLFIGELFGEQEVYNFRVSVETVNSQTIGWVAADSDACG